MENRQNPRTTGVLPARACALKCVALGVLIAGSVALYLYARVFAKAAEAGIALSPDVAAGIASRSGMSLLGMAVAAALIAVTSLAFQTITESRVLTPGMLGFDSVFLATQSVLVLFATSVSFANRLLLDPYLNFFTTTAVMLVISVVMYGLMLRKNKNNIVFLLLFGLILSSIVGSLTNYIEVLLDPQQFQQLKAVSTVTITNMNESIIVIAVPAMVVMVAVFMRLSRQFDVMELGANTAQSLGVNHTGMTNLTLVLVALAMAVTTALIGPLTFLGLLAVNVARELFGTFRHSVLFIGSILVAALFLILGQAVVELTRYATPVDVIINLVGGIYMIVLILKERKL